MSVAILVGKFIFFFSKEKRKKIWIYCVNDARSGNKMEKAISGSLEG